MQPVYLDHNATTPMDPRVLAAMTDCFRDPLNAGSRTHSYGKAAKDAVECARKQVADLLGANTEEVVFTSGATESNNLAILGLADFGSRVGRRHILSTAIEHKAVLEPLAEMERRGFEVELIPVTGGGFVTTQEVQRRLRPDTLLVSVMHANNETGVLQPVESIAQTLAGSDTLLHVDAAQTFGKEVEELRRIRCDFLSISGHKIYGPQGVGALFVRRQVDGMRRLHSIFHGGGQERGLRPGTIPVPLVVGLGVASQIAASEYGQRRKHAAEIKKSLLAGLQRVDHIVNGDQSRCQSHVLNITFPGVDSEALMMALRGCMAISNGSACTSASYTPSHVLTAMGLDGDRAECSVRLSWGQETEVVPVDDLVSCVKQLRVSLAESIS